MPTKQTTWLNLVRLADPSHGMSDTVVEYEFTASGHRTGDDKTHEGGKRVFRGRTAIRGPYAPEE
jgi:hypothetical protein